MGVRELKNNLFNKSQKLLKEIEQNKDIFILSNSTVDGIISGCIILKSIYDNKGNAAMRCSCESIESNIEEIIQDNHDFYIFTDFNSDIIDKIDKIFHQGNYLFINIDPINKSNNSTYENIINPWLYNLNGKEEISTSGLAYFLINNFDINSHQLSYLPIISAISKDQDIGENRSLIGLNEEILQTSLKSNIIEQKKRLTISEIETMSITNVLENNIIHYIKEITWNNEYSLKVIKDSHLPSSLDGNIKPFNELNEKEFIMICDSIERLLQENSKLKNNKIIKDLLFGYNYILIAEENEGFIKNIRSFVKAINSCLNAQQNGLALSLCLGDRGEILKDVSNLVIKNNNLIKKISSQLFGEKWRFYDDQETIFINGEGILNISNLNTFMSFMERSISFADRLICLRILDSEEFYKFIIIKTKYCNFNLVSIKEKIKQVLDNEDIQIIGNNTLEIKIPTGNLEDFLSNIKKIIINEKFSQS
ncbi:MAG: DHH family phosphoesterase [Nitrosopumilus sp.]|nr:DHH family phosphoesterase [Nitrosopumilus sp.]